MRHIIKIILLFANLLLSGALLMGAYSGLYPSRIGVLFELTFPFSLLATIAFFFIWLVYKPKYILIPIATILLAWGGISRYFPVHIPQPIDNAQPGFTLMSYNAYSFSDFEAGERSRNRTLDFILLQDADVVCLQEVIPLKPNRHLHITQEQIDTLLARYPYQIVGNKVELLGILSKYPVRLLSETTHSPTSATAIYQVNIDGHPVTLVNQHLESIGLTKTDKELYQQVTENPNADQLDDIKNHLLSKLTKAARVRNKQADRIAREITRMSGAVIICGDFNDSPLSYAVRRFQRMGFQDLYSQLGFGPGITYHANRFWFRIDHILYRGDIEAVALQRPRLKCSDHYPLIAQFKWIDSENSSTQ